MKETIVYLPVPHRLKGVGEPVFIDQEVYSALDNAGVKWVQETPEEHQIRMMSLQIEELKGVCAKLQDQNEELKMTCSRKDEDIEVLKAEIRRIIHGA